MRSCFLIARLMLEHEKGGECLERVFLVCEPGPVAAALPEACHIEPEVRRGVGLEAVVCECEEAAAGGESALVGGVMGEKGVFLEMDEGACDLDERLIEGAVWSTTAEPEVFEDVVCFVVLGGVEAGEKGAVFAGEMGGALRLPLLEPGFELLVFFHSRRERGCLE
ncbi:MAG: hypothetical protein RLZZ399_861 [Verrucomicrobiota bacterium]|jgi:hypothetical protein